MLKLSAHKPQKIFYRILIPFVISVVAIIFIASWVLYFNFSSLALDMIYEDNQNNLKNVSLNARTMNELLSSLALQCYFDDTIKDILTTSEVNYSRISRRLQSYKSIFPYLDSIYVYSGQDFYVSPGYKFVYSKDEFVDLEMLEIIGNMELYPSKSLIPRKIDESIFGVSKGEEVVYTYLFYESQKTHGSIDQAIVLNVTQDWLRQGIETFNNGASKILVIDGKGRTMIDSSTAPALTDLSGESYISDIQNSGNESGYFTADVGGEKTFITWNSANALDWTFIAFTPNSQVTEKIEGMRNKTVFIALGMLLLGLLITLYLSRRLFLPVKSLVIDVNTFNDEKRENLYKNKQEFISQLVLGDFNGDKISQSKKYNLKIDLTRPLVPAILKLDNYNLFCSKYNLEDRNLMKFAIMNIAEELLSQEFSNECCDMGEDSILVLMNNKAAGNEQNEILLSLFESVRFNVEKYLELSVTAVIGSHKLDISDLKDEYNRLTEASEYRMIQGRGSIIQADNIRFKPEDDFSYPYDTENELVEAIMLGQAIPAKEHLDNIVSYAGLFGRSIVVTAFLRLLLTLSNTTAVIQKNNSIAIGFRFTYYLDSINNMETTQEILDIFYKLFDSIESELDRNKDDKHSRLIEQVMEIVEREYASPDLSLDKIADAVKVSPYYLSKLFKKYKFISLNDHINSVRLMKARDMLIEREELPISEIMEKTGFLSRSQFFPMFKKAYGVTPSQFRKSASTAEDE